MRSTTLFSSLALSFAMGTTAAAALPSSSNGGFNPKQNNNNNNNGGGGGSANPSALGGFGAFRSMCTMPAMKSCAENGHDAPDCFEHLCPMAAAMSSSPKSQNESQGQHAKRVDAFSCTDSNLFQCAIEQWRPAQDCILELCP
jgi:hypothetical protein